MNRSDDAERELLALYREGTRHDAKAIDASLETVMSRIASGEAVASAGSSWLAKLLIGATVVASTGGAWWLLTRTPSEVAASEVAALEPVGTLEPIAALEPPAVVPVGPTRVAVPERVEDEPPARADDKAAVPIRRSKPPRPTSTRATPEAEVPASLAPPDAGAESPSASEEFRLMRSARKALREGQPARALELLDALARRFPDGAMAIDREASRVTTLCALGRKTEAAAAARAFAARYPGSPQLGRLDASCR